MLSIQNRTPSNAVSHLTYHVIEGLHFISYGVILIDLDIIIWNKLYKCMGYCPKKVIRITFSMSINRI